MNSVAVICAAKLAQWAIGEIPQKKMLPSFNKKKIVRILRRRDAYGPNSTSPILLRKQTILPLNENKNSKRSSAASFW